MISDKLLVQTFIIGSGQNEKVNIYWLTNTNTNINTNIQTHKHTNTQIETETQKRNQLTMTSRMAKHVAVKLHHLLGKCFLTFLDSSIF